MTANYADGILVNDQSAHGTPPQGQSMTEMYYSAGRSRPV